MTDDLGGRFDERALLVGFLDWYRAIVQNKVADLDRADAVQVMTPTGLSALGVVNHLAYVERSWFQFRFAGRERSVPHSADGDNAVQFELGPSDTVASVLAFYRSQIETSNEIAAAAALDDAAAVPHDMWGPVTLRWILVHMIEETARHAGHLDILRELTDGGTGE